MVMIKIFDKSLITKRILIRQVFRNLKKIVLLNLYWYPHVKYVAYHAPNRAPRRKIYMRFKI